MKDSQQLAKTYRKQGTTNIDSVSMFEKLLTEIPKWNADIISQETADICAFFPALQKTLHAVLLSNIYIVKSVQPGIIKNVDVVLPNTQSFIHRIYCAVSSELITMPKIFKVTDDPARDYKNKSVAIQIIKECILSAIVSFLPANNHVQQYMEHLNAAKDNSSSTKDNKTHVPNKRNADSRADSTRYNSSSKRYKLDVHDESEDDSDEDVNQYGQSSTNDIDESTAGNEDSFEK